MPIVALSSFGTHILELFQLIFYLHSKIFETFDEVFQSNQIFCIVYVCLFWTGINPFLYEYVAFLVFSS